MAGQAAEVIAGIIGGVGSLFKTGYDIWSNERDFDYQKSLQQTIFAREDTAVQRRRADLERAGLNPNLAAGSSAGAGAVVGRSNTPGISGNSIGTALDTASAVFQLRAQREQNQILKNQKIESEAKAKLATNEAMLDNINTATLLGLQSSLHFGKDGQIGVHYKMPDSAKHLNFENNLLLPLMKYQFENQKNSADLLQRDVDFYTADKIAEYFGAGVKAFGGIGQGLYSFGKYNKFYK